MKRRIINLTVIIEDGKDLSGPVTSWSVTGTSHPARGDTKELADTLTKALMDLMLDALKDVGAVTGPVTDEG